VKKYALIIGLAALAGALAKAATVVGALGFSASTTAFLVIVIVGAGELVRDYLKKVEG
jgi:branched-subunit amino acid ABC-type transport system permease component